MTDQNRGYVLTLLGFGLWGVFPLFFKQLDHIPPGEIIAHRIIWTLIVAGLVAGWLGRLGRAFAVLRDPRGRLIMFGSTVMIGMNWSLFVYAVVSGQALEASLGYFINPLVSVALGLVVLKERMSPLQAGAVALAMVGVGQHIVGVGELPWIALTLAVSFGVYGLLRKIATIESLEGLVIESALLAPAAALCLVLWQADGGLVVKPWVVSLDSLWLVALGGVTALPLLCFAAGARLIPLSHVGLCQYITPTLQFSIAVFVFDEAFTTGHLITFGLVWMGLALFTIDLLRGHGRNRQNAH